MTEIPPNELIKYAIFYASYLYIIAAPLLIWLMAGGRDAARFAVPPRIDVLNLRYSGCLGG